jgi:hypothetical protein
MTLLDQFTMPLAFDTYSPSFQDRQQTFGDFSPASYSSLEDLSADLTNDWSSTPGSPLSPVLTAGSYVLAGDNDWTGWMKSEQRGEPFEGIALSSIPEMAFPPSPAINPIDLTLPSADGVFLGREDLYDSRALFQTPTAPSTRPQPAAVDQVAPAATTSTTKPASSSSSTSQRTSLAKRSLRKRKSSPEGEEDQVSQCSSGSPPPALRRRPFKDVVPTQPTIGPKKTTHNMIEKRYRNNLNDKIAALRDSVPALRVMVHRLEASHEGEEGDEGGMSFGISPERDELGGITPAHKLNKATILGKATEYILHLERRNQNLAKENAALKSRVEGFEMLVMSRSDTNGMWN